MKLKITTLSENTAGLGHFLGEWGLSILVEIDDLTILLDVGQGISASHNADLLGTDLCRIDKIVLSHGHYDHTGGLRQLLQKIKKEIEIIAHPIYGQPSIALVKGKTLDILAYLISVRSLKVWGPILT